MTEDRVGRWEGRTEWPLAGLAVVFLAAYAWPILDDGLSGPARVLCRSVDYTVWVVFIGDYLVRLMLAQRRLRYMGRHLPDLAVIALPMLRPLRLLRLLALIRVLNRRVEQSLRGRIAIYVGGALVLLLFCSSLAVLDAEQHVPSANIKTFGDAVWWSIVTVATVGYGDHYPVTTDGRIVAVGLMVGGIALIGVVTASFATWLLDRVRATEQQAQVETQHDLGVVIAKLDQIAARLDVLEARRLGDKAPT
jgi:voltage-gated potassium channel